MAARPLRCATAAALFLGALLPTAVPARAGERVFRLLDQRDGLPAGEVVRLVQDSRGFIWMGSFAGLVRYDGEEFRRWAPERLNGHVSVLIASPRGDVLVRLDPGRPGDVHPTTLYRIVGNGVEPVAGPDGVPLSGVSDAAFGDDGLLCATQGTGVLCQLAGGDWVRLAFEHDRPELARVLRKGPSGSVLAATDAGLWQIDAGGGLRRIASLPGVADVVPHRDGSLYATTFDGGVDGRLVKVDAGRASTVVALQARPIDLTARGDVIWASFDRFVAVVRPGEPPEILGPESGLPSGGPMLADRENSLWLGTYSGVMHLPEPDTVVWTERDGLPSAHTRFVEVAGDVMWIGTWQGLGRLRYVDGRWQANDWSAPGSDRICLDGGGRLWMLNSRVGIVRHEPDARVVYPNPKIESWLGCHRRHDGTLLLSTSEGLFVTSAGDHPPRRVASNPDDPPGPPIHFRQVLQDRAGRIWVTADTQVCHAPAAVVLSGRQAPWQCRHIDPSRGISSIVELPDGDVWISTDRTGVWRYNDEDGEWSQLPGSAALPSYSLRGLVPSADGVWILGHGTVARVRDDHTAPDGWTVVERLTGLHGLPSAAAERIVELPNGSVWIATIVGLVHVPAPARTSTLAPPAVELVDVLINGRRVGPSAAPLRVGRAGTIELRFAALTYRDRGLLVHEYRMDPESDWTSAPSGSGVFRFPGLAPGSYTVEVRASLDGRTWTTNPASVSFEVLPPWYRRAWAQTAIVLLAAAALLAAHQLRLAFLLRFERQRTRIAMDLHDEVGSGLASINLLAGLAAERTPPGSPQGGLVNQIAETAADLGASLGEIVWSLRSRSGTIGALVSHLSDRAVKLFPTGTPAISLAIPDALPPVGLSLSVRWNVALIAVEALHNAARHAGASRVGLGLEPEGRQWRLWVEDDGRGIETAPGRSGGLANMRERAEEIGAKLAIDRNQLGGLTVSLVFDPQGKRVRADAQGRS